MGRPGKSLLYGFDESGTSPMMCAIVVSSDMNDAQRYEDSDGGLIEKRYNSRFLETDYVAETPTHIKNGGGCLRRVVENELAELPDIFLYAGIQSNGRPPPNEYRIKVIASLLSSGGLQPQDRVYVDAFSSPGKIIPALLRELGEMGIRLPADHVVCEYHADEKYPIVNDADFVANTLYHSRSGEFRDHRIRIDLRTNKRAAA